MITVTDLFCGAGGSGLGATAVPGVQLLMAANHWQLAIDTHAHHMLVRNNGTRGQRDGLMCTPIHESARTVTATGHQSLVGWDYTPPAVQDCTFRMLTVPEIRGAMAFTPGYTIKGTKREQVRQLGNAVTPPAAEWLIRAVVTALGGA